MTILTKETKAVAGDSAGVLQTGRKTSKNERESASRLGSIRQWFGSGGMMVSAYEWVARGTTRVCLTADVQAVHMAHPAHMASASAAVRQAKKRDLQSSTTHTYGQAARTTAGPCHSAPSLPSYERTVATSSLQRFRILSTHSVKVQVKPLNDKRRRWK